MGKNVQKISALLLAIALAALCACAPGQPQAPAGSQSPSQPEPSSASQPAPEADPDAPRAVTHPVQLLGEPDRILVASRAGETALDKNAPEYREILDLLAGRFQREELKAAACAFEWVTPEGETDWAGMAEDFDYIRLCYDQKQEVTIQCMSVPEGDPPTERLAAFSNMVFPLGEEKTSFLLDRETYGVLENSPETMDKLQGYLKRDPVAAIMNSYYLDGAPELKGTDIIDVPGVTGDNTRLVPRYTTGTNGREEMQALLEKLLAGEKLGDHLLFDKRYYFLAYDSDGKIAGHGDTNEDFEMGSFSAFTEESADLYRQDFRYPELLETAIREGKIDPATAGLKYCDIVDFATGALLYDDTREYFIPTVGDAMHTVEFEVGALYPVPELAAMLMDRINELFDYPPVNNA